MTRSGEPAVQHAAGVDEAPLFQLREGRRAARLRVRQPLEQRLRGLSRLDGGREGLKLRGAREPPQPLGVRRGRGAPDLRAQGLALGGEPVHQRALILHRTLTLDQALSLRHELF